MIKKRIQKDFIVIASVLFVLILVSGTLFHLPEQGVNPRLHSFPDALWLAEITASTTGYGDVYPITPLGRLLAAVLSFTGFSLIGVVSALTTSYILSIQKK